MKKSVIILIVVAGILLLGGVGACSFFTGTYNNMVVAEEGISGAWAQVENQYQRRLDLIPNLVETVRAYAEHEQTVFTEVAEARASAGGVMEMSADVLNDPAAFERFQEAQSSLSGALQRLLVTTENYPTLKADQQFLALQDQLEGTENRIAVERMRFNESVQAYNSYIRLFPQAFIASMMGFTPKAYFASESGAATAPTVSF
ncbi:MAG: LemA family protein [Spirochaetales bacterium]